MTDALVHIGTHKTGTTAFQQWAQDHRGLLRRQGIELLDGAAASNYEVALLTMRRDRTMSMKLQVPEWCQPEWRAGTTARIREQVAGPGRLLVTAEALSLLRHEDEVEALVALLSPRDLRVAVCLRDPATWLASYRSTLTGLGEQPSRDPSSHAYVEPDTWLTRWDEMISTWRQVLGDASVTAFGYEEAMAAEGTTVPGVLDALGVGPLAFDGSEARLVNVSQPARRAAPVVVPERPGGGGVTGSDVRADEQDIAKVILRYATGIDRRDWVAFRSCFTDDVVAEYEGVGTWTDSGAITDFMVTSHESMGHTMHRLTNIAIDVDGDTATARTYVDGVLMAADGGSGLNPIGFYDDELVRTPDGWRIARRRFTMVHFRPL